MKRLLVGACAACAFSLGSTAHADIQSVDADLENWGADGGGDGSSVTPDLIFQHTFSLPAIVSLDSLSFELAHSFLSDVHIVLTAPVGAPIIITQGDGPGGNPLQGPGDSSSLGDGGSLLTGTALYNFVESGGATFNDGAALPDPPAGDYNALNWAAGGFAAGDWTVEVWDAWDTLDDGALGTIEIAYTVPAPGAMALLGLAGIAGARRRRRA